MALSPDDWVPLGEVTRPHGVRGEVRVRLYNADSDLLLEADEVLVRLKEGEEHEVSIDRARRADDAILLKLYSIDDRDRADELRGAVLSLRRRDFPALEDGEFYHCDLVGARALVQAKDGEKTPFGVVEGFRSYPTVEVLAIRVPGQKDLVEVPILGEFVVSIDAPAGEVVLQDVDGFIPELPRAPVKS